MTASSSTGSAPARRLAPRDGARIAGYGLVLMAVLAGVANFLVVNALIVPDDAAATVANVASQPMLLRFGIAAFVIVVLLDVAVAWGLHVVLRRAHADVSLLAAWSRVAYAAMFGLALAPLLGLLQLATGPGATGLSPAMLDAQASLTVASFQNAWLVALLLFAFHLAVLGVVALRASFMPKALGWLLLAAGAGYAIDGFAKMLFPAYAEYAGVFLAIVAIPAVVGELSLAIWLIVRAKRIPSDDAHATRVA